MHKVWISEVVGDSLNREDGARARLARLGRAVIESGARVAIKPNLTYPIYKPGVTTSPAILEALIRTLQHPHSAHQRLSNLTGDAALRGNGERHFKQPRHF